MKNLYFVLLLLLLPVLLLAETVLQEGFENGSLPDGWSQEFVSGNANWTYTNGGYNGHPATAQEGFFNARFFYNSTSGATTRLVTREFNLGIQEAGTLTFWHAQQSWVGYQDELKVYYKNSPGGNWLLLASYTENISSWTMETLILPNPSTTYYLAFEGYAEYGYGVCLDNIHVDGQPMYDADLQGVSLTGENTVTAGTAVSYGIMVRNAGIESQNNYTVRLRREGGILLGSALITESLQPGQMATHYILWNIPASEPESYTYLYGEVDLPEDENPYNNTTESFNIHVLPEGIQFLLEEDFESGSLPADWSQEYVSGSNNWIVQTGGYLSHPPSAHSGTYNAAFLHNTTGNSTRLITPELNLGTANNGTLNFWHAQAVWAGDQDQLHIYYKNSPGGNWNLITSFLENTPDWVERTVTLPDPSTTYYVAFEALDDYGYGVCLDDIVIIGQPTVYDNDLAALTLSGSSIVNAGNTEAYQITVKNVGNLPQSSYLIKLLKAGNIELASLPVNTSILPGEIVSHTLVWNIPVSEPAGTTSIYGRVDLTGDENPNNNTTSTLNIEIFPQGIFQVTVGTGTDLNNRVPVSFQYLNSLTETLYQSAELGNVTGFITSITYYNNFQNTLMQKPTVIWMGETTALDLAAGWVPASQLTQVFDGNVDYPAGQNEITINLTTPYFYEGNNLIIMAHRPLDTNSYGTEDKFVVSTTPQYPDRTRYERDNVMILDPYNPPEGYMFNIHPNTTFTFFQGAMGNVEGFVFDNEDAPIPNAQVNIEGTQLISYTDTEGYYYLGNIQVGNYTFTAAAFGYNSQSLPGTVEEGQTLNLDFTLNPLGVVDLSGRVVASDDPQAGLENATVSLSGFTTYQTSSGIDGYFNISGIYSNNSYYLEISHEEYQSYTENIVVGTDNIDLGTITLNEITISPANLQAEQNDTGTLVTLTWDPPGIGNSEFRYDDGNQVTQIGFSQTLPNAVFGAVHAHNARIEEVHWYLTSVYGAHSTAKILILGLDSYFEPDPGQQLLLTGNLPNTDNQWNIYSLPSPVNAPNGFFVGVITPNIYTGMALDDGIGAPWEFVPGTQLASENWNTGDWTDIGDFYFTRNMLIRAHGFDFGELSRELVPTYSLVTINDSSKEERSFESYNIYRFPQSELYNTQNWSLIGMAVTDTTYIDDTWPSLQPGNYQFAITAVHTNNVESLPSFSNVVIKTTPASSEDNLLPVITTLFQNIPNPFNPQTRISYQLAQGGMVSVRIFNIKGELVKILLQEVQEPGNYHLLWNASEQSSGLYFYHLVVDRKTVDVKKCLLIK